jgi:hypothetical protein
MVGLVHVIRDDVGEVCLRRRLRRGEGLGVRHRPRRGGSRPWCAPAATVGAITTFGYDRAVVSALFTVAGMPGPLLRRLRDQEVAAAISTAREEVSSR